MHRCQVQDNLLWISFEIVSWLPSETTPKILILKSCRISCENYSGYLFQKSFQGFLRIFFRLASVFPNKFLKKMLQGFFQLKFILKLYQELHKTLNSRFAERFGRASFLIFHRYFFRKFSGDSFGIASGNSQEELTSLGVLLPYSE